MNTGSGIKNSSPRRISQHHWLKTALEKFDAVFRNKIKNLRDENR